MKAWVGLFTGAYFETEDNCSCSPGIAVEVPRQPSVRTGEEIKIQKEMTRLLRAQALKNLNLTGAPSPE